MHHSDSRASRTGAFRARSTVAAIAAGVVAVAALTAAATAPAAAADTGDQGGCLINAVISQDITYSFSDENLADTKTQIQDAAQSFVDSPYPVTLGITTFGQVAPLPTGQALLGAEVSAQEGADRFTEHVADYAFDEEMSGYTNWQAGLREAFERAKEQGADTVIFVTDGVPNAYVDDEGDEIGVGGWGTFDPAAAAAAAEVAEEIRAAGMHLETVFMRTGRPGFHGLDDPELPTPDAAVEEAMGYLQPGWAIDEVITIAELADELRERAAAACSPELSLVKSHGAVDDVNGNGLVDAGDRVVFFFAGRNDGDLPLTDVRVTDDILAEHGVALEDDGLVGDLGVGEEYRLESAPYTITEQDMLSCGVHNIAAVDGESIKGGLRIEDEDVVVVDTQPEVSVETSTGEVVDAGGDGVTGNAGDTVTWDVVVTNTGNVPWEGAEISAELPGHGELSLTPERAWDGSLAPGESISFATAPHTITAADEAEGMLRSTVAVTAPDVCGTPVTDADDASFTPHDTPSVPVEPEVPTPEEPEAPSGPGEPSGPAEPEEPGDDSSLAVTGGTVALGALLGVSSVLLLGGAILLGLRRRRANTTGETLGAVSDSGV